MKKILVSILLVAACSGENKKDQVSESLSPVAFKQALSSSVVLLDVRTPEEYASGIIAGAQNLDFKSPDFAQRLDSLNKSQTYMLYCAGGTRSDKAAEIMREKGFEAVSTLKGGLNAWTEEGLSLE